MPERDYFRSGTNIYTGNDTGSGSTIVSNGALLVNGSISNGPVSVTGGTLGGSGSIGGTVPSRLAASFLPERVSARRERC